MALQFDGNGIVTIPSITLSGAFTVTGTFTYQSSSTQILFGSSSNTTNFLATFTNGSIYGRINTTNTSSVSGLVNGQRYDFILTRDASNNTVLEVVGVGVSGSRPLSGNFVIDNFGSYNNGALKYTGLLSDNFVFSDGGTPVRDYDFEQPELSTTVPDSKNSQDGTLVGFTSGGFTAPAGAGITITSPSPFSGTRADISGNGVFTISGTCQDTVSAVEVSTDGSNWSVLDASPTTLYSGTVTVNGQKTVYVRAANDVADTASVDGITAGFCILPWGQSNCAGRGVNPQTFTVPQGAPTPIMFKGGVFTAMADPTGVDGLAAGSLWPLIVQDYINRGIPVIVGNVGEGGSSIQQWNTSGSLYNRISTFATSCGGIDLAISIIGETDSGGTTKTDFKTRYLSTAGKINTDYGCDVYAVKFPIGQATPSGTQSEIREAYDELIAENSYIKFGGDLSVIDIDTGVGEDSLHLKTDQHLSEGAAIISSELFSVGEGIPLESRGSLIELHSYLVTQGYTGPVNQTISNWLSDLGYDNSFNQALFNYLRDLGYTGSLPVKLYKWKQA